MSNAPVIDTDRIANAILATSYSSGALELGSELCEAWALACAEHDQQFRTLMLEAGFYIQLQPKTWLLGACDRVMADADGPMFEESKSTANKKSKTWGSWEWFDSICEGHQIGVYGAAMSWGTFVARREVCDVVGGAHKPGCAEGCGAEWQTQKFSVVEPRVLVRAATKFKPVEIWPTPAGAIVKIAQTKIESVLNVARNAAEAIRAMRGTGVLPWALVTHGCTKVYGFSKFPCGFLESCKKGEYKTGNQRGEGLSPGSSQVLSYLVEREMLDLSDPEVVILSSSSLEDYLWCAERFRRRSNGEPEESKVDFEIGSVMHEGLHQYRLQMQEQGF